MTAHELLSMGSMGVGGVAKGWNMFIFFPCTPTVVKCPSSLYVHDVNLHPSIRWLTKKVNYCIYGLRKNHTYINYHTLIYIPDIQMFVV